MQRRTACDQRSAAGGQSNTAQPSIADTAKSSTRSTSALPVPARAAVAENSAAARSAVAGTKESRVTDVAKGVQSHERLRSVRQSHVRYARKATPRTPKNNAATPTSLGANNAP